jgi:Lrp/AsnC family leucine-responsive transcriptional regulator
MEVLSVDALDRKILSELMQNGRVTLSELSEKLGLSSPSLSDRIRKLEKKGIIRGFTVLVDPEKTGYSLLAFLEVTLEKPLHRKPFLDLVADMEEVLECHHMAGDYDYLLKVRCRNTAHLEEIVSDRLKSLDGIARTRTSIALSTVKESFSSPLGGNEE